MPEETVLVVNAGSSSLKYELRDARTRRRLAKGLVDRIGRGGTHHLHRGEDDAVTDTTLGDADHGDAVAAMLTALDASPPGLDQVLGVGHRVVHGGTEFTEPTLVDDDVLARLDDLGSLAPLHNPVATRCIRLVRDRTGALPQVAVFDTAFHATLPDVAYSFALPDDVTRRWGLRRYGFHGTSVEYVTGAAARLLGVDVDSVNLIVCHLGNGASVTAVRAGHSVDTSMGFTPLSGLVMGTRSGDVDASVVLRLEQEAGMTPDEVAELLERRSGLLGLTGDPDMLANRERADAGDPDAQRAVALVAYRICHYVGAYLPVVPGLHGLVFTGGIGEHDSALRAEVCRILAHLGMPVDPALNAASAPERGMRVGAGPIDVLVVPTDEEAEIAEHTVALIRTGARAQHQPQTTLQNHQEQP
ncbi:acetate kinase [Mumia flava]|uniref:Acetate kinase n=1 Tax=Mumia flava TaxID=1348852 RepID=A0A2M9BFH7_9ACTN|nr:acetate/propionate family kinase [Mumia flava]PJJ56692.1 acetate kinase [Mumia flava]